MKLFIYEMASAGGLGPGAPPSLRAEGWAMLTALVDDFLQVDRPVIHTLLENTAPRPLGQVCRHVAWRDEPAAFSATLSECDAALVIAPECDGRLAERSRQVRAAGKTLLGPNPDAIAVTADKLALAALWQKHGVPTPAYVDPGHATFPVVCKPRHGAGSLGLFRIDSRVDLSTKLNEAHREAPTDDILVQNHVTGQPASVAFLVGKTQTLPLLPTGQVLSRDGRFRYGGGIVPLSPAAAKRAVSLGKEAIACVPGLAGYIGVDLVLGEDGMDWAIEINPRLTTSYVGLRQLAKSNLADIWWRLLKGEKVAPLEWHPGPLRFFPGGSLTSEPTAKPNRVLR